MKKFILCFLSFMIMVLSIMGCTSKGNDDVYETVIRKVISTETYKSINFEEDVEAYQKQLETVFDGYVTKDGLVNLYANRTFGFYKNFFDENNVSEITDLKIEEIENKQIDDYTYIRCEVSYTCKSDGENIQMKDYYVLNLVSSEKKYLVSSIYVDTQGSSIYTKMK